MTKKRQLSRRNFLIGTGGAVLFLPTALESIAAPCVPGMPCEGPQRFIIMHHSQGTVLSHWIPTGTETNFTLPSILAPLNPHKDDCLFIGGLDNVAEGLMSVGNGHQTADASLYTCGGFADESVDGSQLRPANPSLDQVVAGHIQGDAPIGALNLGVTGGNSGNNYRRSYVFAKGFNDSVVATVNPQDVYYKFLAAGGADTQAAANLLARRVSVLDNVLENFNQLKGRVSQSDQLVLEAHATKVFELEQQFIKLEEAKEACAGYPLPVGSEGYQWWNHEFELESANMQMDIMLFALSCGLTNVATLEFMYAGSPTFPWLEAEFGGPLIDTNVYDNWHGMVHSGRNIDGNNTAEPGLILGYRHYSDMFALLLTKMKQIPAGNGQTLLDTSLVLWGSEFGDGLGHNSRRIPLIMAGTTGGLSMGRWLNYFPDVANHNSGNPTHSINAVFVGILQAFGMETNTFGNHMGMPEGPLPGILS